MLLWILPRGQKSIIFLKIFWVKKSLITFFFKDPVTKRIFFLKLILNKSPSISSFFDPSSLSLPILKILPLANYQKCELTKKRQPPPPQKKGRIWGTFFKIIKLSKNTKKLIGNFIRDGFTWFTTLSFVDCRQETNIFFFQTHSRKYNNNISWYTLKICIKKLSNIALYLFDSMTCKLSSY